MKTFICFISVFVLFVIILASALILHPVFRDMNINKCFNLVAKGDVIGVKTSLDQGVSPNASDKNTGISLLTVAAALNQIEVVKLLLERGATADTRTDWGVTPFMVAASNSYFNLEIAKLLLSKGVDPKAVDTYKENALMRIAQIWNGEGCHIEKMDFLLSCGLDINAVDKFGNTALIWAASRNNATALKWLIEKKADLNHVNKKNATALNRAIKMNKPEPIRILKEAGAKTAAELKQEKH